MISIVFLLLYIKRALLPFSFYITNIKKFYKTSKYFSNYFKKSQRWDSNPKKSREFTLLYVLTKVTYFVEIVVSGKVAKLSSTGTPETLIQI